MDVLDKWREEEIIKENKKIEHTEKFKTTSLEVIDATHEYTPMYRNCSHTIIIYTNKGHTYFRWHHDCNQVTYMSADFSPTEPENNVLLKEAKQYAKTQEQKKVVTNEGRKDMW
jgi:hypothetical protein